VIVKLKKGHIFVISGPSGSGKTTILSGILKSGVLKGKLTRSISLTTRQKRSGERQGRDYFFVSDKEFKRLRKAKKILEWTRYLGYYYATPKDFIENKLKQGKYVFLCLDLRGALKLKRVYGADCTSIFILAPSLDELHRRITSRCHLTKAEEIRGRLSLADKEVKMAGRYDFRLMNKDLQQAGNELKRIVLNKISDLEKKGR
jgi:guanylate kinase